MKINASAVNLSSQRQSFELHQSVVTSGIVMKKSALDEDTENTKDAKNTEDKDSLVISKQAQDSLDQSRASQGASADTVGSSVKNLSETQDDVGSVGSVDSVGSVEDKYSSLLKTLRQILKMLRQLQGGKRNSHLDEMIEKIEQQTEDLLGQQKTANNNVDTFAGLMAGSSVDDQRRKEYVISTSTSTFDAESENTSFSGIGTALTDDGRSINFNVSFEMSRSFMEYNEINVQDGSFNLCDPLTINVGANVTQVSDQKFRFDLDSDGNKDSISMLSSGSGFLAYDRNGNGTVDDGSELFGTKSGDGFKDLAAYDEDGNGWIDENDDIYDRLRVWCKDDEGNDKLLNLKEADVGAIFTGKSDTQFSLKSEDNSTTNGMIRSTGIYLKESGGAGTVQHVDLAL